MREDLAAARLREEWRQAALKRLDAAEELIQHQDSVRLLTERGMVETVHRQGLAEAVRKYEDLTKIERLLHKKLEDLK